MAEEHSIDQVLSPWVYNGGAPPAETRLLSTGGSGDGHVQLTPEALRVGAASLAGLRGEVEGDVNTALRECANVQPGPNLLTTKAIAHVQERWVQKLGHLLSDFDERISRLQRSADKWSETEKANTAAFKDAK